MSNLPLPLCKRLRDEAGFRLIDARYGYVRWNDPQEWVYQRTDAQMTTVQQIPCPHLGELLDFVLAKRPDCRVELRIKQTTAEAQMWTYSGNRVGIATGEKATIAMANLILDAVKGASE